MSHPAGDFLEALLAGGLSGYNLRDTIRDRRKRRADEEEERRFRRADRTRMLERGRLEDAQLREETGMAYVPGQAPRLPALSDREFGEVPEEVVEFRRGVGRRLGELPERRPFGRGFGDISLPKPRGMESRVQFGGVEQVDTPRAVVDELGYDPDVSTGSLEGDITRGMQPPVAVRVGHAIGQLTGRKLSDDQAAIVGRGMVPASALRLPTPRSASTRPPITLDRALMAVDRMYGRWDPDEGRYVHDRLTEAQRYALAKKMVSGEASEADFPGAPTPTEEPEGETPGGPNLISRIGAGIRRFFSPGPSDATAQGPGPIAEPTRTDEARQLLADYADLQLSQDEVREILRDAGYSDEEIEAVLGGNQPTP